MICSRALGCQQEKQKIDRFAVVAFRTGSHARGAPKRQVIAFDPCKLDVRDRDAAAEACRT